MAITTGWSELLTHTISAPRAIEVLRDEDGRDRVLWIESAESRTRLRIGGA